MVHCASYLLNVVRWLVVTFAALGKLQWAMGIGQWVATVEQLLTVRRLRVAFAKGCAYRAVTLDVATNSKGRTK